MTMKGDFSEALNVLLELQVVDLRLRERQQSLAEISLTVSEKSKNVKVVEEQVQRERETLKRLEMNAAQRELDIKTHQARIAKLRSQLNLVKNQKEYDALGHEISAAQTDSDKAEDEALQMMSDIDDVKRKADVLQQELADAKRMVEEDQRKANEQVRQASIEMRQLRFEREALVTRLDPEVHKKYERILHNKGERAVAEVVEHVCTGCNMGITKQSLSRLMARREIIQCPNCLRILYLREEQ